MICITQRSVGVGVQAFGGNAPLRNLNGFGGNVLCAAQQAYLTAVPVIITVRHALFERLAHLFCTLHVNHTTVAG